MEGEVKVIIDIPNVRFTDEQWIYILKVVLVGWTEIPLNPTYGYNKDKLKFYDGIIGLILKDTERIAKHYPKSLNKSFVNSWKYQGKLFRVMHGTEVEDNQSEDGFSLQLPEVEYHEMITHWTTDYTFSALMNKLRGNSKYIILEADTSEHFAFDVNRFREVNGVQEIYTQEEREVIFPMYKDCIKEHRMTINEFVKMKNSRVK
jgi:hypothetical protein